MNNKKSLFHQLDSLEQKVFISQLVDAIRTSPQAYYDCYRVIKQAEQKGLTKNIHYLNKNYQE